MSSSGDDTLGAMDVVKLLGGVNVVVTRPPEFNEDGWEIITERSGSPLWMAAHAVYDEDKAGGVELTKLLIEKGADVNAVGKYRGMECTPLWWGLRAVWDGHAKGVELAKLLVDKGADVNAIGKTYGDPECTPLCLLADAVKSSCDGAPDLARLLVSRGAHLLPSERAEWQSFVDSTSRTL